MVNNLLDELEDPLDLRHNPEEALISPGDDGTCTLNRIYNHLSSCNIGILVHQVSQEIHYLSATHIEAQETKICMVIAFPDFLHLLRFVVKFHRFVEPQVTAADPGKMEQIAFISLEQVK